MTTIQVGPKPLDLKLYAGDGFALSFGFVEKETGNPWPADGEWVAEVRAPSTATDPLFAFAVDLTHAIDGVVNVSVSGDQARSLLGKKNAEWDLQQTVPGSEPRTWYRGKISATQDVTQ